ncbi:DNA-directed RNA polymerase subunit delta [Anaerorhabdus sp.]|uniref:DNA-directed RNA polymerase subunit delta n=1 Tax=Anaerorhabdus sp. TaxID=1872524 RepID=UPI002FC8AB00
MTYQSMTDVAHNVLTKKKKGIEFNKLWGEVSDTLGFDTTMQQRKIAQFYTELMLDTRFASLADNKWDLRSRHLYNEIHVEVEEIDDEDFEDEFADGDEDEDTKRDFTEDDY